MNSSENTAPLPAALDDAFYKTLLESTRAIPWAIDWQSLRFTYIGPQIQALLGWVPESWGSVEDWAARMHPDDRDRVVNFCVSQSREGVDHEADYRALTADGRYVWIRDVVHVIRKDGEVQSLVGFMFDISERKQNEERLLALQKDLEALSYQDSLTGIANRRLFDLTFKREWASACRNARPLSLIVIDIDYFKQYNDRYGHAAGDVALQAVTQAMQSALRASDLAARLGGEEFVIVLPETDRDEAVAVAERIRGAIAAAAIAHAASPINACLTVSQGIGTIVPTDSDTLTEFVEAVDRQLYRAKREGRNRCAVLG